MNELLATYHPLPLSFVSGEGVWLWDNDGNRYLDAISGLGVNTLGHGHSEWVQALQQQAEKLIHVSNLFTVPEQTALAQLLCSKTGMEKAFFASSGSEANECAIKLARLYGHRHHIDNPTIIVFERAFHGRTLATLTASGFRQVQAGFEPLVSGFIRAPFGDISALEQIAESRSDVVAVLFEPIQGSGGVRIANQEFLLALQNLCKQQRWLLIADEVQTGGGRTGEYLATQQSGIQPDIITLAKGLANGIPLSACLTRGIVNDLFSPGSHGSTFGGNPFACSMALATQNLSEKLNLTQKAREQGENLLAGLQEQFNGHPLVQDIRAKGLLVGIELTKPCKNIETIALSKGLLVNVTQQNVIRLLPPLVIDTKETALICEKLTKSIDEFATIS